MYQQYDKFAARLVNDVLANHTALRADADNSSKLLVPFQEQDWATVDLTPFAGEAQIADAAPYFNSVQTTRELVDAYNEARQAKPFERDLPDADKHISDYAAEFLEGILARANHAIENEDARRIAGLVSQLDTYAAVQAVESLLSSHADLALLKISEHQGWTLHFDHLAIRCGCSEHRDAERVVESLKAQHGYVVCQVKGEDFYEFADGWNAYMLYKMLDNGQQLRLFVDQSTPANRSQIIQHWNHVYGYTAHHLAIRATQLVDGQRVAVPLAELTGRIEISNIEVLTATGQYTSGLLEQVFTRPEKNTQVPHGIRKHLSQTDASLEASIENGKLLELLSRREMNHDLKPDYFALYGIEFDNRNPLHSAPIYQYFLPTQAAHVIRTSVQVA